MSFITRRRRLPGIATSEYSGDSARRTTCGYIPCVVVYRSGRAGWELRQRRQTGVETEEAETEEQCQENRGKVEFEDIVTP